MKREILGFGFYSGLNFLVTEIKLFWGRKVNRYFFYCEQISNRFCTKFYVGHFGSGSLDAEPKILSCLSNSWGWGLSVENEWRKQDKGEKKVKQESNLSWRLISIFNPFGLTFTYRLWPIKGRWQVRRGGGEGTERTHHIQIGMRKKSSHRQIWIGHNGSCILIASNQPRLCNNHFNYRNSAFLIELIKLMF